MARYKVPNDNRNWFSLIFVISFKSPVLRCFFPLYVADRFFYRDKNPHRLKKNCSSLWFLRCDFLPTKYTLRFRFRSIFLTRLALLSVLDSQLWRAFKTYRTFKYISAVFGEYYNLSDILPRFLQLFAISLWNFSFCMDLEVRFRLALVFLVFWIFKRIGSVDFGQDFISKDDLTIVVNGFQNQPVQPTFQVSPCVKKK